MNLDDFSTVVDDRRYINPQVALDESNAFIQKLRDTQSSRNDKIQRDTYNLGTAVPSNLGGLGGSQSYFNARYQTPQTNSLVADLKATAQAQALSDVMSNEIAQAKQRYSNAYKAYAKRHGNNPGTTDENGEKKGEVDFENTEDTLDKNGLDTIDRRSGDTTTINKQIGAANSVNSITGGGQLPNAASKKIYYLVAPNGTKTQVSVGRTVAGVGLDTPTTSIEGGSGIRSYVSGKIKQGYKVQDAGGHDMTSTYGIVWGI